MQKEVRVQGISGSTLKLIAIITMLIDHIGAAVVGTGVLMPYTVQWPEINYAMRLIGRVAFPIFCFLLVEGFTHTHDVKKYALRLLAFCFISEIPFDLAIFNSAFYMGTQNVFFTLFIGLLVIIALKKFEGKGIAAALINLAVIAAGAVLADLLRTDYASFGVCFIAVLYLLRKNKLFQTIAGCVLIAWEFTAPLAFIPIWFYNGKRGLKLKYVFYIFYPLHLIILYLVRCWLL